MAPDNNRVPRTFGSPSFRLRASESFLRSLMIIALNSINRASLRRSSFGLHKKLYRWPSLPRIVIFRGFCNELMMVI